MKQTLAIGALALAGLGLDACGREVPASWPEKSAASPTAEPAPAAVVTQALSGPPPLPGEASSWVGLGKPEPAAHDHGGHAAVRYTCPMHPDVVSEQPGQCPRCGMNLVEADAPK